MKRFIQYKGMASANSSRTFYGVEDIVSTDKISLRAYELADTTPVKEKLNWKSIGGSF